MNIRIPWRIKLGTRRILASTIYAKYYHMTESYLQKIGIADFSSHLIERTIKGVGFSLFNARCIEARTVPGTWEQVISLLPIGSIQTVADVGCGNENPGRIMEKMGLSVAYSDIENLTHIGNFCQMNFNDGIKYEDKSFDYAISVDVIEHLENTRQFCRELMRISRKGFIVATPNPLSKRSIKLLQKTGSLSGLPKMRFRGISIQSFIFK